MTETPANKRLHVLQAVEDGWNAFTKAPWPLVLFTLLAGGVWILFQIIVRYAHALANDSVPIAYFLVVAIGSTVISLWGITGLIRGAWKSLNGAKPSFSDLVRWDGNAAGRLFINQIALAIIIFIIALVFSWLTNQFFAASTLAGFIPLIAGIVIFIYLSVNQKLLPLIALLQTGNAFENIQKGQKIIDATWWWMLLLLIVNTIILTVGVILNGVGLLVASPLVICISLAAYRQLFGTDDQTGFLNT
jgi:uncharacterized membrane protein